MKARRRVISRVSLPARSLRGRPASLRTVPDGAGCLLCKRLIWHTLLVMRPPISCVEPIFHPALRERGQGGAADATSETGATGATGQTGAMGPTSATRVQPARGRRVRRAPRRPRPTGPTGASGPIGPTGDGVIVVNQITGGTY